MAQQIKKKFIGNDQIDGEKLKLSKGQSVRGEDQQGQEVDLLKLDQDDKVLLKGEEAALKSQVDAEQLRAEGEESRIEGKVDQEVSDRIAGDNTLQSNIDDEQTARIAGDANLQAQIDNIVSNVDPSALDSLSEIVEAFQNADSDLQQSITDVLGQHTSELNDYQTSNDARVTTLEGEMDAAESRLNVVEADLAQEVQDRTTADTTLQSNIDAEEAARIAGDADLQNKLDVEIANSRIAEEELQANIDAEQVRAEGQESAIRSEFAATDLILDGKIDQEIADRQQAISTEEQARIDGDNALDARLSPIEGMLEYKHSSLLQDAPAVYADAMKGKEDPSSLKRDGWYYTNDGTPYTSVYGQPGQNKINWYFYYQDGINPDITLGDFSAYTVMTFDDASESPIMGVYTPATGSGDAGSFYHSRVSYSGLSSTPVVGKKYLVYFGQEPEIHPELPRLELSKSALSSVGDQDPNEIVGFVSFGTNGSATVGDVKFMVESLGVNSPQHKTNIKLKIHHATQEEFDALQAQVDALDGSFTTDAELAQAVSDLQSEIDADVLVEKQRAEGEEVRIEGKLDQEVSDRQAADTTLQSNIDTEKARIDAILDASEADKDSFKEIVDLINSVDTENDQAFASYVLSNNAALAQEISDRQDGDSLTLQEAKDYVDLAVSQEAALRTAEDFEIDGRLNSLESYEYETEVRSLTEEELSFVSFSKQIVPKSMVVSIGRLMMIKGIDYELETMESKPFGQVAREEVAAGNFGELFVMDGTITSSNPKINLVTSGNVYVNDEVSEANFLGSVWRIDSTLNEDKVVTFQSYNNPAISVQITVPANSRCFIISPARVTHKIVGEGVNASKAANTNVFNWDQLFGESGTKLTWIGSVAQGGVEALSEGYTMQAVYEYRSQL